MIGPAAPAGRSTGTISLGEEPVRLRLAARCWLRRAKASWSARDTWKSCATFSPVSGIESVPYRSFIALLTKRQPMVVS